MRQNSKKKSLMRKKKKTSQKKNRKKEKAHFCSDKTNNVNGQRKARKNRQSQLSCVGQRLKGSAVAAAVVIVIAIAIVVDIEDAADIVEEGIAAAAAVE